MRVNLKGILIIFCIFLASIIISSLVYAAEFSEAKLNGEEWIEIYNNGSLEIDLSLWTIEDSSSNNPDTFTCEGITECNLTTNAEYFLILGKATAIENITSSNVVYFYTDDQKIGNGLNDGGDSLTIKENGSVILTVNFSALQNTSLSLQYNGTGWCEGEITPGAANSCLVVSSGEQNQSNNSSQNESSSQNQSVAVNCSGVEIFNITSYPYSMIYGSSEEISVSFNSTCYNWSSVKILVYGESKRFISYNNDTKIKRYSECEEGSFFKDLENKSYSWNIPFYTYSNCDGRYEEGNQSVGLRVCNNGSSGWERYNEEIISIKFTGKNSSVCTELFNESIGVVKDTKDTEQSVGGVEVLHKGNSSKTEVVYESKDKNNLKIAVFLLGALFLLLLLYLIIGKGKV